MADERLRQLERAALAGDPETEARRLMERVRTGDIRRARVEAAASEDAPGGINAWRFDGTKESARRRAAGEAL